MARWVIARQAACVLGCVLALVLFPAAPAAAQREHFQLKIGASYDQGDFGTPETTHSLVAPVTLRYLGGRFDFGVTSSFVYLDAPRDVTFVDGSPDVTRESTGRRDSNAGLGDTLLKARLFAVDDPGPGSWLPSLTPFVKLKLPTADEDRGLGTGKPDGGLGVEFDKQLGTFFILGDASYTFMGDPPDQNFRDRPAASLGAGVQLGRTYSVTVMLDWRRALLPGRDDLLELLGIVTARLSPTLSVSPHFFAGLTDGSPDFGLGFEVSYRFGRW